MKLKELNTEELCSTNCCGPKPVSKCHCGPECPHCDCYFKNKKSKKKVKEGVLEFPQKKRDRAVRMEKLKKKSKYYDEMTGLPTREHPDFYDHFPELRGVEEPEGEYWLVSDDGKGYAVFDTEKEANQRKPEIEMKYGVRGLHIVPMS